MILKLKINPNNSQKQVKAFLNFNYQFMDILKRKYSNSGFSANEVFNLFYNGCSENIGINSNNIRKRLKRLYEKGWLDREIVFDRTLTKGRRVSYYYYFSKKANDFIKEKGNFSNLMKGGK